jgi:hypothetical protein
VPGDRGAVIIGRAVPEAGHTVSVGGTGRVVVEGLTGESARSFSGRMPGVGDAFLVAGGEPEVQAASSRQQRSQQLKCMRRIVRRLLLFAIRWLKIDNDWLL